MTTNDDHVTEQEPAPPTTEPAITDADDLEAHLARLEEALAEQLKAATEEDYDRIMEIGQQTTQMLKLVTTLGAPVTHVAFEHIRKIQALHHQLGLTLSTRSEETAEQLSRVRNGRNGISAYQNNV
jgi:ABC-type Zn2+ transport system substrate-binding protein/surface adhesin